MDEKTADYGAISIDTSVFVNNGLRFSKGLISQLKQFNRSPVHVLVSDIVFLEVCKHLSLKIESTRSTLRSAMSDTNSYIEGLDIDGLQESISGLPESDEISRSTVTEFFTSCDAKTLNAHENVSLKRVVEMYFASEPPFEAVGRKKEEFPDALALLAIEAWAIENDTKVLLVSSDKGWKDFAQNSAYLSCMDNLATAMEIFQPYSLLESISTKLIADYFNGDPNHVLEEIQGSIMSSVISDDIDGEAHSDMIFEFDGAHAEYTGFNLIGSDEDTVDLTFVHVDSNEVTFRLAVHIDVLVNGYFSFYVRDSVDGDTISIGSNEVSRETGFYSDVLVTLSGDFSDEFDSVVIDEIEVLEPIKYFDFGYINFSAEQEEF